MRLPGPDVGVATSIISTSFDDRRLLGVDGADDAMGQRGKTEDRAILIGWGDRKADLCDLCSFVLQFSVSVF